MNGKSAVIGWFFLGWAVKCRSEHWQEPQSPLSWKSAGLVYRHAAIPFLFGILFEMQNAIFLQNNIKMTAGF